MINLLFITIMKMLYFFINMMMKLKRKIQKCVMCVICHNLTSRFRNAFCLLSLNNQSQCMIVIHLKTVWKRRFNLLTLLMILSKKLWSKFRLILMFFYRQCLLDIHGTKYSYGQPIFFIEQEKVTFGNFMIQWHII